jgi:hypothetical protein
MRAQDGAVETHPGAVGAHRGVGRRLTLETWRLETRPGVVGAHNGTGWRLTLGLLRICRLVLQIHIALTRIWDLHKISRIRFASVLRIRIRTYG